MCQPCTPSLLIYTNEHVFHSFSLIAYFYGKRGLLLWQKGPTSMANEPRSPLVPLPQIGDFYVYCCCIQFMRRYVYIHVYMHEYICCFCLCMCVRVCVCMYQIRLYFSLSLSLSVCIKYAKAHYVYIIQQITLV